MSFLLLFCVLLKLCCVILRELIGNHGMPGDTRWYISGDTRPETLKISHQKNKQIGRNCYALKKSGICRWWYNLPEYMQESSIGPKVLSGSSFLKSLVFILCVVGWAGYSFLLLLLYHLYLSTLPFHRYSWTCRISLFPSFSFLQRSFQVTKSRKTVFHCTWSDRKSVYWMFLFGFYESSVCGGRQRGGLFLPYLLLLVGMRVLLRVAFSRVTTSGVGMNGCVCCTSGCCSAPPFLLS